MSEAEWKLWNLARAKTIKGRVNYVIDLLLDLYFPNPLADELAHFGNEFLLGKGPPIKRIERWSKKFRKYRLDGSGVPALALSQPKRKGVRRKRLKPKVKTGKDLGLLPVK